MFSTIINILLFILVIGFLTLIHELGHFIVAKLIGAKVYEFSLGFGPKLISKKYKETVYSIRMIPLGGYVKILGDGDPGEKGKGKSLERSEQNLNNKPRILQMLVMLAGVFMNIVFAIIFYYIILFVGGWKTAPLYYNVKDVNIQGANVVEVLGYQVVSGGNAETAGMPKQGVLREVDGKEVYSRDSLVENIKGKESVEIIACNEKEDECKEYRVSVGEEDKIGVLVSVGYVLDYTQIKGISGGVYLVNNLVLIADVLGSMISSAKETGDYTDLSNTVSGPVGIFLLIDNLKDDGIVVFLSLLADLSVSLAIMNLLPIPALDGGRVLILLVESIFRKDLNEKVEAIIINVSMLLLILFIVLVMIKDIVNFENMKNMFG